MKRTLTLLFALVLVIAQAQVPSDCTVIPSFEEAYNTDVKHLTIKRMVDIGVNEIEISTAIQDSIWEGMAAIFNADLLESDSVFEIHCVHHGNPLTVNNLIVNVDDSFPGIDAWSNNETITGYQELDDFMETYNFEVTTFLNSLQIAFISTDQCINMIAATDFLETIPGVTTATLDGLIGGAGEIIFWTEGDDRYYDFELQWGDCFDGCDNIRTWHFKVADNCDVTFLGAEQTGAFGIMPLPDPVNCEFPVSVENIHELSEINLFPNPATSQLTVQASSTTIEQVHLSNTLGQLIQMKELSNGVLSFDVAALSRGIYFVQAMDGNGKLMSIRKVVLH